MYYIIRYSTIQYYTVLFAIVLHGWLPQPRRFPPAVTMIFRRLPERLPENGPRTELRFLQEPSPPVLSKLPKIDCGVLYSWFWSCP